MKVTIYIILLFLIGGDWLQGQEHYTIKRANFSSDRYNEFSPVITGSKLVFCSNQDAGLFITYTNKDKKSLFKIFAVQISDTARYSRPILFSRDLSTPFNDGPISFDSTGRKAVYSRNINIGTKQKEVIPDGANLGLFLTENVNGKWTNIKSFKYNSESYSNTTPFLSQDGKDLYFASDKPGGFGGFDLYRCSYSDSTWSEPENLGKEINTNGNEAYPFVNAAGVLFFASDGHKGLGRKDIFMSSNTNTGWTVPIDLDPPINSSADDFSLITDSAFTSGYFASDRNRSDDIFRFETKIPQLFNCDTLKLNQYCFRFWDEKYSGADSLPVEYQWQFSDGTVLKGLSVEHCFPGAGKYWAKLVIVDKTTSNTFFNQTSMEFEIKDFEQPFILSKDTSEVLEEIKFSGLKSNLPEFQIDKYIWDFGDGSFMTGADVAHTFNKEGVYNVKLGVSGKRGDGKNTEIHCIFKSIRIYSAKQLQ